MMTTRRRCVFITSFVGWINVTWLCRCVEWVVVVLERYGGVRAFSFLVLVLRSMVLRCTAHPIHFSRFDSGLSSSPVRRTGISTITTVCDAVRTGKVLKS